MPFHFADHFHSSNMTPSGEKQEYFDAEAVEELQTSKSVVEDADKDNDAPAPRPRQDSFHQSSDNLHVGL